MSTSLTHELTVQIIATVASGLILAALNFLGKHFATWAKRRAGVLKENWNNTSKTRLVATLRYISLLSVGIINIPLNSYFLWHQVRASGAVTRMDVLEILLSFSILVYWLVYTIYLYRKYSVADYLADGA